MITASIIDIPVIDITVHLDARERLERPELRDHVEFLRASILQSGYLRSKPLTVRIIGESVVLVDGACRLAAVRLCNAAGAGIDTLPCLFLPHAAPSR
jgi:hypothetical protein